MALPDMMYDQDVTAKLPPLGVPCTYPASLQEIEERFVIGAPFCNERKYLFKALELFCRNIWNILPEAEVWVNGGFVTHKSWAAPKDIDVCVLYSILNIDNIADKILQNSTLQNIFHPTFGYIERIQPYGGMLDVFFVDPTDSARVKYWHDTWLTIKDKNGNISEGNRKGFIRISRKIR